MGARAVAAVAFVVLTAACQLPGAASSCNAQIDWVNFIQVGTTQYVAGPTATLMMAEMGAEIIKVEAAPLGDPSSFERGLVDCRQAIEVDPGFCLAEKLRRQFVMVGKTRRCQL